MKCENNTIHTFTVGEKENKILLNNCPIFYVKIVFILCFNLSFLSNIGESDVLHVKYGQIKNTYLFNTWVLEDW